jgi:hypothetical protein
MNCIEYRESYILSTQTIYTNYLHKQLRVNVLFNCATAAHYLVYLRPLYARGIFYYFALFEIRVFAERKP